MDLGESMASAMDSEESMADQLAKLQEQIDFKARKLAELKAENARKAQELREKRAKLATIKHFEHETAKAIVEFFRKDSKIGTAEPVVKTMAGSCNEAMKMYKECAIQQIHAECLNKVVSADILRANGEELGKNPTPNLADLLRRGMPVEHGKSEEWKNRVEASRKMWQKHLDEFPLN